MQLYKFFVITFITCVVLAAIATFFYLFHLPDFIMQITALENTQSDNPADVFRVIFGTIFSPFFIVAILISALCQLAYKIIGIVLISNNKSMGSGEKLLWILGFIFLGFITAIVFMALKNSRNLLEEKPLIN